MALEHDFNAGGLGSTRERGGAHKCLVRCFSRYARLKEAAIAMSINEDRAAYKLSERSPTAIIGVSTTYFSCIFCLARHNWPPGMD